MGYVVLKMKLRLRKFKLLCLLVRLLKLERNAEVGKLQCVNFIKAVERVTRVAKVGNSSVTRTHVGLPTWRLRVCSGTCVDTESVIFVLFLLKKLLPFHAQL